MSANHLYIAPLFSNPFHSLEEAKWNLKVGFKRSEAIKYFGKYEYISHYIGDRLHSVTPILVDEIGNISFGKTRRV